MPGSSLSGSYLINIFCHRSSWRGGPSDALLFLSGSDLKKLVTAACPLGGCAKSFEVLEFGRRDPWTGYFCGEKFALVSLVCVLATAGFTKTWFYRLLMNPKSLLVCCSSCSRSTSSTPWNRTRVHWSPNLPTRFSPYSA